MSATTTPISIWLDEVMTSCPGASQAAYYQAFRAAVREFCVVSGAWIRELSPIDIRAGKKDYYLDPQPNATVLFINSIMIKTQNDEDGVYSRYLHPVQTPAVRAQHRPPSEGPWGFYCDPEVPGKFTLTPEVTIDIPDAMIPTVSLTMPTSQCDILPMHFARYYFDILLDGTLSKLMSQQDKPFTNLMTGQYHARRFRAGMARARDESRKQHAMVETKFSYPAWA